MKKFVYLLFALLVISCSLSNEDKIRAAFKDYVKSSFDDPSQFEEIVSIDSLDTISTLEIKKDFIKLMDLRKEKYAMCDSFRRCIFKYVEDKRIRNQLVNIDGIRPLMLKEVELQGYLIDFDYKRLSLADVEEDLNEILALKDTIFNEQRITYRIKTSDGLKIKSCYAYSDTLYNNIVFKNDRIKAYDVSDILKEIDKLNTKYAPLFNIYDMKTELDYQILSILRSRYDNLY